jgi:hypothetical protein
MIGARPYSFDVLPLRRELNAHPEVWDQHPFRRIHPRSPHRQASDIWIRYNALENLGPHFNDEHESVWYPVAKHLPAAKRICNSVADIENKPLAGVLITKIPAGKEIFPHRDLGWHAEHTLKIGVLVQGNKDQKFCFEDSEHACGAGDCFWFTNQDAHWVTNETDEDRVTLIVCVRTH